eukprot:715201-Pyramimonas_sp.AAC.2
MPQDEQSAVLLSRLHGHCLRQSRCSNSASMAFFPNVAKSQLPIALLLESRKLIGQGALKQFQEQFEVFERVQK